jgi:hypothetical protein
MRVSTLARSRSALSALSARLSRGKWQQQSRVCSIRPRPLQAYATSRSEEETAQKPKAHMYISCAHSARDERTPASLVYIDRFSPTSLVPRHMPLPDTLPLPSFPQLSMDLLLPHRDICVRLDEILHPLPKTRSRSRGTLWRHHEISQLSDRDERLRSRHRVRIVQSFLDVNWGR